MLTAFDTRTGTTHLTEGRALIARPNKALCGRTLNALAIYGSDTTERITQQHARLNAAHDTGTCRGCFDKKD